MNSWVPVSPGSDGFVYIEDNTFRKLRIAVATGQGGMWVFRNNFCEISVSSWLELHPACPDWLRDYPYAGRYCEVYANTFVHDDMFGAAGVAINFRGGEALVHNNTFSHYSSYVIHVAFAGGFDEPGAPPDYTFPDYPVPYQPGYNSALESELSPGTGKKPSNE